jgi:alkanesulfonate monooxygenase SsuD/methylene tetrahydromethanopterin reductase-like flavin-dependent oxidoreductase (luciferase family)
MMPRSMKLSILDQSPIIAGHSAAQALEETLKLARRADALGYTRYWLAEHHAIGALADPCPEILLARLGAETSRIRIGTGGVLLPYYSAFKTAEIFRMLEALYPGRIDLGIGRAPGGDQRTARAVGGGRMPTAEDFPQQVWELVHHLDGTLPDDHPFRNVRVQPEPHTSVCCFVICAQSDAEAERLAKVVDARRLDMAYNLDTPVPTQAQAEERSRTYTDQERAHIHSQRARLVHGSAATCRAKLLAIAEQFSADELMVLTITGDYATRLDSYERLAQAFKLG